VFLMPALLLPVGAGAAIERTVSVNAGATLEVPKGSVGYALPNTECRLIDPTTAEDVGMGRVSVMDHVWQIGPLGPPEEPMLEAYTTLGYLAARTSRVELVAWVTAVSYRDPGLLAKIVSTLDVLSNGRAWLGIGAAWNGEESEGLGLFFPPTAERFERLEETLRICLQMWSDDDGPFEGTQYRLGRTLNSPQPLRRPHPPILIGGGGEKKTLRLVAQYAQACNLFAFDDVERKLDILRRHCADVGRDYDEIEKTVMVPLDTSDPKALVEQCRGFAKLGVEHVHGFVPGVAELEPLRILGRDVIPAVAEM